MQMKEVNVNVMLPTF